MIPLQLSSQEYMCFVLLQVDLKAVSEVTAFSFYRDHLPVLETYASYTKWSIGDRVRIDLDLETFQSLQENHGGWVDNMEEVHFV